MSLRLESFSRDEGGGRALYLLTAETPEDLDQDFRLPDRGFVCLLAWDAPGSPDETVLRVAERLLNEGAKYVCTWGRDCERVHDLVDEAAFDPEANYEVDPVIMTTWHHDEPLEEAIYFFLSNAHPDDEYFDECTGALAISLGDAGYAERIRLALREPDRFRAEMLKEG